MTDIWYTHLYGIVKVRTRTPATPKGVGPLIVERSDEIEDTLGMCNTTLATTVVDPEGVWGVHSNPTLSGLFLFHG